MATIRVDVTADDIKFGERGNGELCPVARALHRATGRTWAVEFVDTAYHGADAELRCNLPDEAQDFIEAYDDEELVNPFAFDVDDGQEDAADGA